MNMVDVAAETSPATVVADRAGSSAEVEAPPQRTRLLTTILDLWELAKPEIALLVVISALAGFLLGSPGALNLGILALTLVGTGLSAAGGGALNHFAERSHDALMRRTARRPLPSGRMPPTVALLYGLLLAAGGLSVLFFVNLLTAFLAALTVALYVLVYTPLKRKTTFNSFVGLLPGALPGLGGYTAATGELGVGGWLLFIILACWQMPHLLSLAWMYRKDYQRARYIIAAVTDSDGRSTALQILAYSASLVVASVLPTIVGLTGWVYLAGAAVLGIWFMLPSVAFYRTRTSQTARRILISSIVYIPLLVCLIVADRLVPV